MGCFGHTFFWPPLAEVTLRNLRCRDLSSCSVTLREKMDRAPVVVRMHLGPSWTRIRPLHRGGSRMVLMPAHTPLEASLAMGAP